jgi:hypothetical protein
MVRGVDELGKDGRIIGWRVYLVPWMFTKRPLAVKNPLMMIYFWEFHWSSWRLVGDRQSESERVASLNTGASQIAVIASFPLSYLVPF